MTTTSSTTKNKGLAATTTNPENFKRKSKFTDNSIQNQSLKILDWLFEPVCINTAQARDDLDVMSPAQRIMKLRRFGYLINTVSDGWISGHRINYKGILRHVLTQTILISSEVA